MSNVQEEIKDCSEGTVEEVVKAPLSIVQSKTEKEIMKELHAPFDSEEIEWRILRHTMTSKGLRLIVCAYVTVRAVQQRLDEVFGVFGWRNEFKEWGQGATLAGISVKWNDEWITKWDGGALCF